MRSKAVLAESGESRDRCKTNAEPGNSRKSISLAERSVDELHFRHQHGNTPRLRDESKNNETGNHTGAKTGSTPRENTLARRRVNKIQFEHSHSIYLPFKKHG